MSNECKYESVVITQFILYAQNKSAELCRLSIGDDPQLLTTDEMWELRNDYIKKLEGK